MQEELLMEIRVRCDGPVSVKGTEKQIVMIPFTGEASGPYFNGRVVGTGVDTQTIGKDGKAFLSARYMLEGDDAAGSSCRIFVENQGSWETGFTPKVVTDPRTAPAAPSATPPVATRTCRARTSATS